MHDRADDSQQSSSHLSAASPPFGLRVAASLCAVVGVLSVFGALAVSLPLVGHDPRSWLPLTVNLAAAFLMCAAAVLTWRKRRLGVACVVLAWALPTLVNLLGGAPLHAPSLLMVLALVTLAGNWHELG